MNKRIPIFIGLLLLIFFHVDAGHQGGIRA